MNSKVKEPNTAPPAEQWFPLTLGSTFREPSSSTRFYSLRYEFKPASIDTTRPGSLFKSTDNKVTVDLCNNQAGKPKVSFQGNSEECKELDGVIFFDGKSFRLERLHRAVKSLRHLRLPGESTVAANASSSGVGSAIGTNAMNDHSCSPGHLNGAGAGLASNVNVEKITPLVQVEEISVPPPESLAEKKANKRKPELKITKGRSPTGTQSSPTEVKANNDMLFEVKEVDATNYTDKKVKLAETSQQLELNIEEEEHESDYEVEDVVVSDDEDGMNAAEALRAQVAAGSGKQQSSSASSGSSSGGSSASSSGSGSSSSSGSDGSDDESASSGHDI